MKYNLILAYKILLIMLATLSLIDCEDKKKTASVTAHYPKTLSSNSSPSKVAEVLIEGLDTEDTALLTSLVAIILGDSHLFIYLFLPS